MSKQGFTRPSLEAAVAAWKQNLAGHGLPTEQLWIFAENLCIEPSGTVPGGYSFCFQTKFSPPDSDALEIAYDHFSGTHSRIVFYRLGSSGNKSICILLCDSWFEEKKSSDGYERRDDWKISFRPGPAGEIEEVKDLKRWVRRIKKRDHAFHDFDFSMALETIDEIKMHGRPLHPYERLSQRMINRMRTILGPA
jgi:hypothetical protein